MRAKKSRRPLKFLENRRAQKTVELAGFLMLGIFLLNTFYNKGSMCFARKSINKLKFPSS